MRRYDSCPKCGATGQTSGLYCHECGADVTYEDVAADQRDQMVRQVKASVSYWVHAAVALVLLLSLALVLLYFWGNKTKGATTVLVGLGAALETEQVTVPVRGDKIILPARTLRGPLMLSFRYALSPPHCRMVLQVKKKKEFKGVFWSDAKPATFVTGVCRFRVPVTKLKAPFYLQLLQDEKPIATLQAIAGDS